MANTVTAPPYSFDLYRKHVDELVKIDDHAMRRAMRILFLETKLALEPASIRKHLDRRHRRRLQCHGRGRHPRGVPRRIRIVAAKLAEGP